MTGAEKLNASILIKKFTLSKNPPCPGNIVPLSLTLAALLIIDSIRSPVTLPKAISYPMTNMSKIGIFGAQ